MSWENIQANLMLLPSPFTIFVVDMRIKQKYRCVLAGLLIAISLQSCFTGIENTGRISEKDVAKVKADVKSKEEVYLDSVKQEGFLSWKEGKRFYVADNNVRLILTPSVDSLRGAILKYAGYATRRQIDNSEEVVLRFVRENREFRYDTGKTKEELSLTPPEYLVPFLVDLDFVESVGRKLVGLKLFLKTSQWKRADGSAEIGLRYMPVTILSVGPGDAVYPFYVSFECGERKSGVFMSSQTSSVKNMTFGKLFSFTDIREEYKSISDVNWELITHGKVAPGMTKSECSLSLGAPLSVGRTPTYGGLYERWQYMNGVYLIFENGLLINYRQ